MRIDTYGADARVDVSFVQLAPAQTSAAINGTGNVRSRLETLLLAKGFDMVNKVYLAYYEGDGDGCASAAWASPTGQVGTLAVLYLRGATNPDCPAATFVAATDQPPYWEFRAVHEILHPIGFAPYCAPPAMLTSGGHVIDEARDLLYGGSGTPVVPTRIDALNNTYLKVNPPTPGCFDLTNSSYVDQGGPTGDEPPMHPYVKLTPDIAACSTEGSMSIALKANSTTITFVNATDTNLQVAELVAGALTRGLT